MSNVTLAVIPMKESHTSKNLAKRIEDVIKEFDIEDKVVATTHDNAQNITKAISENRAVFGHSVRCLAHSLQLCLNEGLTKLSDIADLIEKCRSLVGHFKHSYKASEALEDYQKKFDKPKHKLMQSVSTRWNSTYTMIERIVEQRNPILGVLNDRAFTSKKLAKKHTLDNDNWELLCLLIEILKPFELATKIISGEKYPTASLVLPLIDSFTETFLKPEDGENVLDEKEEKTKSDPNLVIVKKFKEIVRDELKIRFGSDSTILKFATFFDPRYKNYVQNSMNLRKKIEEEYSRIAEKTTTKEKNTNSEKKTALELLFPKDVSKNSSEVENYLTEHSISKDSDVLVWWRNNASRYPILSKLANKYLCISATSVPSERVFSTAGNVISSKRNCLSPNKAKKLIFLYQNVNF